MWETEEGNIEEEIEKKFLRVTETCVQVFRERMACAFNTFFESVCSDQHFSAYATIPTFQVA